MENVAKIVSLGGPMIPDQGIQRSVAQRAALVSIAMPILAIVLLAILAFLPYVEGIGLHDGDWNLIAGARQLTLTNDIAKTALAAPNTERPFWAAVAMTMFQWFGYNTTAWHLFAIVVHTAGAIAAWGVVYLLAPSRRELALTVAAIYLLFPTIIVQLPIMTVYYYGGMTLLSISFFLTTYAERRLKGLGYAAATAMSAVLLGIALLLVEMFLGTELIRLVILVVLVSTGHSVLSRREKIRSVFLKWLPYVAITAAFLGWRVFIFQSNQRTDVALALRGILEDPLYVGVGRLANLGIGVLKTLVTSWLEPAGRAMEQIDIDSPSVLVLLFLLVGLAAVAFTVSAGRLRGQDSNENMRHSAALGLMAAGLIGAIAALVIPIFIGGYIAEWVLSTDRYMFFAMPAAVVFFVGIVHYALQPRTRRIVLLVVLGGFVLTHVIASYQLNNRWSRFVDFWWQANWRIPGLSNQSTIMVVWPEGTDAPLERPLLRISIADFSTKLVYMSDDSLDVSALEWEQFRVDLLRGTEVEQRTVYLEDGWRNLLMIAPPHRGYCLHVLQPGRVMISDYVNPGLANLAQYSHPDRIRTDGNSTAFMPPEMFGSEPDRDWCYTFQAVQLSLQAGDVDGAVDLAADALERGLAPGQVTEWLPIIEAFVLADGFDAAEPLLQELVSAEADERAAAANYLATLASELDGERLVFVGDWQVQVQPPHGIGQPINLDGILDS
ncbi:MAG: hypothetical protein IPK19_15550 [Chloroflexi bacterium]|nr:hypothetical protein [Chloroflexota bacterium]